MSEPLKLFDFINSIYDKKRDLFAEYYGAEKQYKTFIINNGLSMNIDTVLFANEMNIHSTVPKKWQYYFYFNGVSKGKRYGKWPKADEESKSINMIMEYFGYSEKQALRALEVLTPEQLTMIQNKNNKGGRT